MIASKQQNNLTKIAKETKRERNKEKKKQTKNKYRNQ